MLMRSTSGRALTLGSIILMMFGAMPTFADHYAVIFSGGLDQPDNFFYTDTLRMWDLTVNTLKFDPAHVYVLASDGLNPAPDQKYGGNSDWSSVVARGTTVQEGSNANLHDLFATLANTMTPADSFYFWSFTHGGPGPLGTTQMWGWNLDPNNLDDFIGADDFGAWTSAFNVESQIYAFDQCYANGMAYALILYPRENWFAAWSSPWTTESWGDTWTTAWEDGIQSGLRDTIPLGIYAMQNDLLATVEHPGFLGANVNIATGEVITPEPEALALLATAVLLLVVAKKTAT